MQHKVMHVRVEDIAKFIAEINKLQCVVLMVTPCTVESLYNKQDYMTVEYKQP